MSDVAIVGIGMHEFGRNDGMSGMDQGVVAVRRALADCGRQWSDMQFAVGGSMDGGAADTMVSRIGLTGLPFTNVVNGCATGGTALAQAVNTIESGAARRRHRDRLRQARTRRVPHPRPTWQGLVRRRRVLRLPPSSSA